MTVGMFIKWPEGIVVLGTITEEFLEEYFILLVNSMYRNVGASLLWLRLLSKYLIQECDTTRIQSDYFIFYKKYDSGKLELVVFIYVDGALMEERRDILENIKEIKKLKFNIQESGKVKKFLGVY